MPRRERTEADRVLDRARDGENVPAWEIRAALIKTGDLADKKKGPNHDEPKDRNAPEPRR